jgi:hypothetical protein
MAGVSRRTIEHLIGPVLPELGCDECFDVLDTYVELEIAGVSAEAHMPRMGAHLEGCSACRADHDSLLALLLSERENRTTAD